MTTISLREQAAIAAMQSILIGSDIKGDAAVTYEGVVYAAVNIADVLVARLKETEPKQREYSQQELINMQINAGK